MIAVLGIFIMLYPMTARWVSQLNQSSMIDNYSAEVDEIALAERTKALEDAREYNDSLQAGAAFDPFTQSIADIDSAQYDEYLSTLEGVPTGVMARIRIPKIDVDLPIYHGTTEDTLEDGVGHLYGTALPVGGVGTHSVLTAHSGLADAVLFTFLDRLVPGDTFEIEVYGERLTYEVQEMRTVLPHETESLVPDPLLDQMTLVTCAPIGINSHRLLVTAERIPTPIESEGEDYPAKVDLPGFPWWAVWAGTAVLLAVTYVLFSGGARGRHVSQPNLEVSSAPVEDSTVLEPTQSG
ncbi:MAG: class C sortase [Gulosibacter sp.]|uniref:class C sortase n=1 Tax=Gulosibacter sp. TaxID=2817531 RepID=UPI003F8EBE0B